MSNKAKGSKSERELVEMFTQQGWRAARVAGSGVNDNSPCDIFAGKMGKRGCVVECKSSKKTRIYITRAQIEDFILFGEMMGLRTVVAARFNREGWFFLETSQLEDTGANWVVSLELCKTQGKRFGQFFEN
jgi:Holliday junction resolvase